MPTFIKEILSIILAVRLFPFENLIKRQLKGHDIHQTSSRPDCTHFAKCRKRSIAYCRRYVARECISCDLVKRKPRNWVIVDGVELKLCTHCEKTLPLHRFYAGRIYMINFKHYSNAIRNRYGYNKSN